MKRLLLDVNVVLDVLLDRQAYVAASGAVWAEVEMRRVEGVLSAHAVTTIHYLIRRELSGSKVRTVLTGILEVFGVAAVDAGVVEEALKLPCPDFEDAVTAAAARRAGCEYIVMRDPKRFRGSAVQCLSTEEVLAILRLG